MLVRMTVPASALRRAFVREAFVVLLFAALAVAMTWPLAPNLTRAVSDPGDPYFTTWVLDWDYYATVHHRPLFDANIFYPAGSTLAFSEHMAGIALLLFPLFAAGLDPLTIHNLAMLLGFAGCGYAMYLLARRATGSAAGGILGGIAYAFVGFRFHHLPHLHFVWSMWLPLLLLALLSFAERPTAARASIFGVVFVLNGLTTLHWFAFGSFAIGITAIVVAAVTGQVRTWRYWTFLAAAVVLGLIVLAPFFLPYLRVAKEYGMHRYYSEALPFSAGDWRAWLQPTFRSRLYGSLSPAAAFGHERTLLAGFAVYALALLGLLTWREGREPQPAASSRVLLRALDVICALSLFAAACGAMAGFVRIPLFSHALTYTGAAGPFLLFLAACTLRCWIRLPGAERLSLRDVAARIPPAYAAGLTWLLLGILGARGLHGFLDAYLFDHVSAFRSIRVPARWAMLAYVAIALFAAAGTARLVRDKSFPRRVLLVTFVAAAVLFELRAAPIRWYLAPRVPQPVYTWLRDAPFRGGIVELPIRQDAAYEYLLHATEHHRPLLNGVSSYTPPGYDAMAAMYDADPIPDELFTELERHRGSLVVVHDGLIQTRTAAVRDWLRRGVASGRLTFVRRFDAGTRPDYVFALTRVEPAAASWRETSRPDPAGFTPEQNAERFLATDPLSYSSQTIANIDRFPARFQRGPLTIAGWATSPAGIDHVDVRMANRRLALRAARTDRADVSALLPWHPPVYGFSLTVPDRPPGIDGETDLQLEIADARGHTRLMQPTWFRWTALLPRLPNRPALDALLRRLGQNPATTIPAVLDGRAGLEDYTEALLTDPDAVTDDEFVRHTVTILLGEEASPALTSPYLRLLTRGTSRERVIEAVLHSREFARRYLGGAPVP